jgi:hypothetical protein
LTGTPYDTPSNDICLQAGDQLPLPRGDWLIWSNYCILEYQDPVTGIWIAGPAQGWDSGMMAVSSDGFSVRLANRTGCPVGGIVNAQGSGYVQATTAVAVTGGGGSLWQPIVGGALAVAGGTLTSNGAGYGVAPLVFIPAPPNSNNNPNGVGGVQASGYCTIANGTVSGFTFTNQGAGYPSAPTPVILPNPTDPNINAGITAATLTFSLTQSGAITGLLCTNPGAPLATPNNITLTLSGGGTNATVSAIMMQTIINASVTAGFTVAAATVAALLTTVGGYPASAGPATPITGTITANPVYLVAGNVGAGGAGGFGLAGRPRPAQIQLAVTGAGAISTQNGVIYDGGLFYSVPNAQVASPGAVTGTPTYALAMGGRPDIVRIQPLK